jgi:hypothetical protein
VSTAFDSLDRPALAMLLREYLLCGHLIDRSGMPHLVGPYGLETMRRVAVDEWMGASPIYTRRIQKVLGFEGDDVETIFKGMQFDIGAPPQFMDFRYKVIGPNEGEFWLDCCGALMDVEPLGDEFVVNMCHHIEDPTFDATAMATNPRARMRPIHRPPRQPADRMPHCHWRVFVDPQADPLPEPEPARRIAGTRAAAVAIDRPEPAGDGGRSDYSGPLENDLPLEELSRSALMVLLDEVALQGHLLTLSFNDAVERHLGAEAAEGIAVRQFTGVAGVAADRIAKALRTTDLATVLPLHPAFHPSSYMDVEVDGGTVRLRDCPAIGDRPGRSWADVLASGATAPLDAMVQAIDPYLRGGAGGARPRGLERGGAPPRSQGGGKVTRYSTGADFEFEDRHA